MLFRNDWDPPDRKVDTRKFRSEPRSIFEYEPGKSSILEHERPVRHISDMGNTVKRFGERSSFYYLLLIITTQMNTEGPFSNVILQQCGFALS